MFFYLLSLSLTLNVLYIKYWKWNYSVFFIAVTFSGLYPWMNYANLHAMLYS